MLVLQCSILKEQLLGGAVICCFPLNFVLKNALKNAVDFGWGDGFIPESFLGELYFGDLVGTVFAHEFFHHVASLLRNVPLNSQLLNQLVRLGLINLFDILPCVFQHRRLHVKLCCIYP